MRAFTFAIGSLAAIWAPLSLVSASRTGPVLTISMQIHDGDRLVGSPQLNFTAGAPSTIKIGDAAGNHYAIAFTATPQTSDTIFFKSTIDFVSAGKRQTASPNMLVAYDKPSAIKFGVESPASKPYRLNFTINKPN